MDQQLEPLLAEVEREAREEASHILGRGQSAAGSIVEDARARAEEERQRLLSITERQVEQIYRRARSAAQLAAEHRRQARREHLIQRVFTEARQGLSRALTADQRRATLAKLIEEGARSLGGGPLLVRVAPADKAILTQELLSEVARSLLQQGLSSDLASAQEPAEILGGAIVATRDERVSFDNSWESRLKRQMPTLRPLVWRALSDESDDKGTR
ncbi:MAG: hypothetical protein EPO21_14705 [Chloroflexota bacterium]|nr:MAG: hypothetical protein EPO21_14705 [Chloroflexota bacterium]